jgi:hypothetical protein
MKMLFFGRSFSILVAVVVALLFVSTIYEYQASSVRSRPEIWRAKEPDHFRSDSQLDGNESYDGHGIVEEQVYSGSNPQARPPAPYGRLRPFLGQKDTKSSVSFNEYIRDILRWERPKERDGHWPPYRDFVNRDYDPNRWEGFQLYASKSSSRFIQLTRM